MQGGRQGEWGIKWCLLLCWCEHLSLFLFLVDFKTPCSDKMPVWRDWAEVQWSWMCTRDCILNNCLEDKACGIVCKVGSVDSWTDWPRARQVQWDGPCWGNLQVLDVPECDIWSQLQVQHCKQLPFLIYLPTLANMLEGSEVGCKSKHRIGGLCSLLEDQKEACLY